ncbi:MAG: SCO family protein [Gemmatimonadota bacterium]|nr:SCO family protein [Gemmatimonadota bacterium]
MSIASPRRTLFLVALCVAVACDAPLHGTVRERPAPAPPLVLTDAAGAPFDLATEQGKVVLIYFGYTHCPDVCPTVLSTWARARRQLGTKAAGVRFVFVSVDAGRDTPTVARAYAMQFDSSFVGLTGTEEALGRIKRDWGFPAYPEGDPRTPDYGVVHPASTYVVDRRGRLLLLYSPGVTVEDMASDLRRLL